MSFKLNLCDFNLSKILPKENPNNSSINTLYKP